jgi:hypothetical protein
MTVFTFSRGRILALTSLIGPLVLAGCGSGQKPAIPVKGQLFYKESQPAAGAMVVFHPIPADPSPTAIKPTGEVRADGSFSLTTYKAEDGAPAGDYDVTVIWLEKPSGPRLTENRGPATDRLEGRYGNPAAPKLKATVNEPNGTIRLNVE